MKNFINLKVALLAAILVFSVGAGANAQRRTKRRPAAPKAAASAVNKNAAEVKAGAARVGEQIKTLTQFIYVLGGVRKDIEAIDAAAKTGKATRGATDRNAQAKRTVITSIENVRAGLAQLEEDFHTNPALQFYSIPLVGVNDLANTAEQQAKNNQFDSAGRTMVQIVAQLTDILLSMQK